MSAKPTFLWYDLETFGLDPAYDRIAQFAARRTDADLNPIGDPVVLYCRLSADYLPDPASCLVTGITPQTVRARGMRESDFIERINAMMSERNTCTCGFNSLNFDDEFIRNTLYRNLMDPYEREYRNGCSRWDIIDLVRAAHDLRREGINWPNPGAKGNPVFKLTELTAANRIEHTGAHDAMADVDATIEVARLIKEKQPNLFAYYLNLRNKNEVKDLLRIQDVPVPLIHVNRIFTNRYGCSSLIVPITPCLGQENSIICFNLAYDPTPLFSINGGDVFRTPGLFKLAMNKSPFLAQMNTLKYDDYKRLGIDYHSCMSRYKAIMDRRSLLITKLRQEEVLPPVPDDPDFQIYGKFFSDYDRNLFSVVRNTPVDQKLSLNLRFNDPRGEKMVWRHVCRNWPESIVPEQLKKWKDFSINRLICPPERFPDNSGRKAANILAFKRRINERLADTTLPKRDRDILQSLLEYHDSLRKYLNFPELSESSPSATE